MCTIGVGSVDDGAYARLFSLDLDWSCMFDGRTVLSRSRSFFGTTEF